MWKHLLGLGKKPLTEFSFMTITLEEWRLMSYTQSSRLLWSTGKSDLFCPMIKAQATSAMKRRGKERGGRAEREKEGRASDSQACPSNQQLRDPRSLLWSCRQFPAWLSKALEQRKQAKGFCSPCPLQCFPPAVPAHCLLHALNPFVSTAQWKICCLH